MHWRFCLVDNMLSLYSRLAFDKSLVKLRRASLLATGPWHAANVTPCTKRKPQIVANWLNLQ